MHHFPRVDGSAFVLSQLPPHPLNQRGLPAAIPAGPAPSDSTWAKEAAATDAKRYSGLQTVDFEWRSPSTGGPGNSADRPTLIQTSLGLEHSERYGKQKVAISRAMSLLAGVLYNMLPVNFKFVYTTILPVVF